MSELISVMFSGVSDTVVGLATGIKDMFMNLLFEVGENGVPDVTQLSEFGKYGFLMMGVSLALGLGYVIINKIRA